VCLTKCLCGIHSRRLHSSTFRLNVSTFLWDTLGGFSGFQCQEQLRLTWKVDECMPQMHIMRNPRSPTSSPPGSPSISGGT